MSEENQETDGKVTTIKQEFHIKNSETGEELTFFGEKKDIEGMKNIIEKARIIAEENAKLKESKSEFDAPEGGTTSLLDENQIYGSVKSEEAGYDSKEDAIRSLESQKDNSDAKAILDQLALKAVKSTNRELVNFDIDPRDLAKVRMHRFEKGSK